MDTNTWMGSFDRNKTGKAVMWTFTAFLFLGITGLLIYPYTPLSLPKTRIDLTGEWAISLNDRTSFAQPGLDDRGWDRFDFPGSFIVYAMENKHSNEGICWIRKTVTLKAPFDQGSLGLSLGRISNADAVYFNGTWIGGTGRFRSR